MSLAIWLGVAGFVWALLTVTASFMWDSCAVFIRCLPTGAITAYHLEGWRQAVTGTLDGASFDGHDCLLAASSAWLLVKFSWIGQLGLFRPVRLLHLFIHLHHYVPAHQMSWLLLASVVGIRLCMRLLESACFRMPPRRYHCLLSLDLGMSIATFPPPSTLYACTHL